MEDLKKSNTAQKGKKFQAYSLEIKNEAIKYAELHGNRPAARFFRVHEKRIREWRSKKSEIEALLVTNKGKQRKKLTGGGRKPMSRKLEENLLEWISNRQAEGLEVSGKLVMKKAEITYRDLKECSDADDKGFKASRGWLNRFIERNGLTQLVKKDLRCSKKSDTASNKNLPGCALNQLAVDGDELNGMIEGQLCSVGKEMVQSQLDVLTELQTHPLEITVVEEGNKSMQLVDPDQEGDQDPDTADC